MKLLFLSTIAFCCVMSSAFTNDALCQKCQIIREYNADHPENNITWYEDFQKDHPESKPVRVDTNEKILLSKCNCGGGKGTERPRGPAGT